MKRFLLVLVTLISAFNFAFATDMSLKNVNDNTAIEVADVICPGNTVFGQLPEGPDGVWAAYTSDFSVGYVVLENFWDLTTPICGIHFWGLSLIYNNGWYTCYENPTSMTVAFWDGDSNEDPTYVFEYIPTQCISTGILYADYYELYEFTIEFPSVDIIEGGCG